MKKNLPKVSIIIRTKNEERWIESCLIKIYQQNYKNFEIIIVDNSSNERTLQKAKKFPVKIVKIKKFLPGKAINTGIKKSTGKIIVCLSAHCLPVDNNWLSNLIKGLKEKKVAGVYGRQKPLSYSNDLDKRDLLNLFGLEKKVQKKDTFFHNANSAFYKRIWKKFPFDEKTMHIEDRIWAQKVIEKKYRIIYEPKASVYHWHGINQEMEPERCRRIVSILESLGKDYESKSIDNPKNLKCIAIVPVRGNSIMVNKTLSLLKITINQLNKSKFIKDIYVATDNLITKKIAIKEGAKVPFLRPKSLSESFVDNKTIINFYLDKLEKKSVSPEVVIVATENFPLRNPEIFDKMVSQLVENNYDAVIACKNEKGSIFLKNTKTDTKIIDGEMPSKLRSQDAYISRIGIGYVARASKLRSGSLFSGRLGNFFIKNNLSMTEFNKSDISGINKLLIEMYFKKYS